MRRQGDPLVAAFPPWSERNRAGLKGQPIGAGCCLGAFPSHWRSYWGGSIGRWPRGLAALACLVVAGAGKAVLWATPRCGRRGLVCRKRYSASDGFEFGPTASGRRACGLGVRPRRCGGSPQVLGRRWWRSVARGHLPAWESSALAVATASSARSDVRAQSMPMSRSHRVAPRSIRGISGESTRLSRLARLDLGGKRGRVMPSCSRLLGESIRG